MTPGIVTPRTALGSRIPVAPPDLDTTRRSWERAAHAGHSRAMFNLGVLYAQWMEPPDLAAARRWYEGAANAGHRDAMYRLMLLRADAQRVWWRRAGRWAKRRRPG